MTSRYNGKIDEANKAIEEFYKKNKTKGLPETKLVIYEKTGYPIVYEIDKFFYLGGDHLKMVLKSKCILRSTGKTNYYEAEASDQDIEIGKSPIFPVGCKGKHEGKIYPKGMSKLELKL